MRLRFLGTGTSFGIPVLGCDCATCRSDDPRDRRTRHGALIEGDDGARLLIDTPPELRLQLLDARVDRVDAVWITHCHADHTHGIDDLRAFTVRGRAPLPIHAPAACADDLRTRFRYVFDRDMRPEAGTSRPELMLHALDPDRPLRVGSLEAMPLPVKHGRTTVLGVRCGGLGYVTDAKSLPDETLRRLEGVHVLVLNALWFGNPHPTHLNVEEAVELAGRIGAERTFLTHLTHRTSFDELERRLPPNVRPAYDGLVVDI